MHYVSSKWVHRNRLLALKHFSQKVFHAEFKGCCRWHEIKNDKDFYVRSIYVRKAKHQQIWPHHAVYLVVGNHYWFDNLHQIYMGFTCTNIESTLFHFHELYLSLGEAHWKLSCTMMTTPVDPTWPWCRILQGIHTNVLQHVWLSKYCLDSLIFTTAAKYTCSELCFFWDSDRLVSLFCASMLPALAIGMGCVDDAVCNHRLLPARRYRQDVAAYNVFRLQP